MKISYDVYSKDKNRVIMYLMNVRHISKSKASKLFKEVEEIEGRHIEKEWVIAWDKKGCMFAQQKARGCLNIDKIGPSNNE